MVKPGGTTIFKNKKKMENRSIKKCINRYRCSQNVGLACNKSTFKDNLIVFNSKFTFIAHTLQC